VSIPARDFIKNKLSAASVTAGLAGAAICGGIAYALGGNILLSTLSGLLGWFVVVFGLAASKLPGLTDRAEVLEKVYDMISEAVLIANPKGTIQDVNRAFFLTTGFSREEVIGANPRIMKSGLHDDEFYREMWTSLVKGGAWQGQVWDRKKNGETYPKWLNIESIKTLKGENRKYVGVFSDISEIKKTSKEIDYLLLHDKLTGLLNRMALSLALTQALSGARSRRETGALLVMNISRFKGVNEAFGFTGGDQFLKETSRRLSGIFNDRGTIARTGSDEYSVILSDIRNSSEAASAAAKVITAMNRPFIIKGQYIYTGVNVGICLFQGDATSCDEIQRYAQKALTSARSKGTNQYEFNDPEEGLRGRDKLQIETNLRVALDDRKFVLHYQPLVDLITGNIYGAEALIRRVEPNQIILPEHFIDVAEESGLIVDICEWTLSESAKQQVKWIEEGLPPVYISVNTASMQFHQQRIIPKVKEVLAETGMRPEHLKLEITERSLMHNAESIIKQLSELRDIGIKLSIDDFGTGYSSLRYLRWLPVDVIKIDISFVHEIGVSRDGEALVKAIIDLAHTLGFKALAEGIETRQQLEFLKALGCDEMQGFYFSHPLTADRFASLLREGRSLREKLP